MKAYKNSPLVPMDLSHLKTMMDNTGVLQHATHGIPCFKSGYTTDDNARALIVILQSQEIFGNQETEPLAITCLSFLQYAHMPNGLFHNFVSFDRRFLDKEDSGDSFGRAVWACGYTLCSGLNPNMKGAAKKMIDEAMPQAMLLEDPRPIAFVIMGLHYYLKAFPKQPGVFEKILALGEKLLCMLEQNSDSEWVWFENILTYCNARIPQALFLAFDSTKDNRFLEAAEKSFGFLLSKTINKGIFAPVGQNGWFPKGGEKACFDQQPIDAGSTVEAAVSAFNTTGNTKYVEAAYCAFKWFFGGNIHGLNVYDSARGACFDGLVSDGVNLNQGAESTLTFILARMTLENIMMQIFETEKSE